MQQTMKNIASELSAGDVLLSEDGYLDFKNDMRALVVTVVDILNGTAYLFGKETEECSRDRKAELEKDKLRECMKD